MKPRLAFAIALPMAAAVALTTIQAAGQTASERTLSLDQVVAEAVIPLPSH